MEGKSNERLKGFTRRATLLMGGQTALFALLAGRMYYLQVLEADEYRMLADENRINLRLLAPLRGRIVDRFGVALATNRQNFRVLLIPEQSDDVAATLDKLGRIIPITDGQRARVMREVGRSRAFVPLTVAENLSWDRFAAVNVSSPDIPGIQPDVGETRHYPFASDLAHVVGYVAAVSEGELTGEPVLQLPGFRIGKSGVERVFDKPLRGSAGNSRVEVNAYGRVIREIARQEGTPGEEVVLTVDQDLQRHAMNRLRSQSGAAVLMDIHSGEILALASSPGFDPNAFNVGLSLEEWRALVNNPRKPLINKAVAGQYPPGSTFKSIVALAALESRAVAADQTFTCSGKMPFGNTVFHCWKEEGHGQMNMRDGIKNSCDIYFYEVARRTGIDKIADAARRFGLGAAAGIALPEEKAGLVPDRDWKRSALGVPWQTGETLVTGIGQGFLLATPLQLAVMTARIANNGRAVTPRLIRYAGEAPYMSSASVDQTGFAPWALKVVQDGMDAVMNEPGGTAYGSRLAGGGMAIAGKTGTAQVRRITKAERDSGVVKNEEKPWEERDHALFVGYGPVDDPKYAVAVVVEHGGSGSTTAAPIGRDILERVFKRAPARRPAYEPGLKIASGKGMPE